MRPNNLRMKIPATALVVFGVMGLAGCTASSGIPGAPNVKLELQDSAAQMACQQFAQAVIDNTTREGMTADIDAARRTAAADSGDSDAQRVAVAIDQFLTSTVMGTQQSFDAATNDVIAACRNAGVNLSVE